MRNPENIRELITLSPDYMGLIFYQKSTRYVEKEDNLSIINSIPGEIKKVGVFVKEEIGKLIEKVKAYQLDYVQLHGGESLAYCQKLKEHGIKIIKVFSVEDSLPVLEIKDFEGVVNYFLFDTKTPLYGGSGKTFDWDILFKYPFKTPYFLSGGIGTEEFRQIKLSDFPGLVAIDINSKVEIKPGFKDIAQIKEVKQIISKQQEIL